MAVEARHGNPLHSQMIANRLYRDFVAMKNAGANGFSYAGQVENFIPLAATAPADPILPLSRCHQQPGVVPEMLAVKPAVQSDSGLSTNYNAATVPGPMSLHKRSREVFGDDHLYGDLLPVNQNPLKMSKASAFLGQEAAFEIQRQQSEIDCLISQHTERLRLELEEKVKQQSRALLSSIHDSVARKLGEKDEEIQRIGKLNWLLQDKVKSLVMENQIWRGLAQTNEAAAKSLRSNLEQALARGGDGDAQSCCGSNDPGRAGAGGGDADAESRRRRGPRRGCRACGKRESSVLLLPCRHLCLCAACGPSHHDCPACGSAVTASVHVNLSPSS